MKNKNLLITILLLVIVSGLAFVGGMTYQKSKLPAFNRQFAGRAGFRPVNGEIISADGKSITVKLQDGSSKIILLSAKTEINKAAKATNEDLKVGEKVMVVGQENSDGSVTAQNIQLNPISRNLPTGVSK